jgi:hypothetical protein
MATLSEEERRGVFDVRYRAFLRCASCDARGACSVRTTVIESQLFLAVQAVVLGSLNTPDLRGFGTTVWNTSVISKKSKQDSKNSLFSAVD